MNKKGFTLTELLVVVAIIAVLSVIVIPSIISVNKNINSRLYSQKIEYIETSASLYGTNNDDIFNGTDEVELHVYDLIINNYLNADVKVGDGDCTSANAYGAPGCLINPNDKTSMNNVIVILRKENIGVVAKVSNDSLGPVDIRNDELVTKVCEGFNNGSFVGKYGTGENDYCHCVREADEWNIVKKADETQNVDMCLISGENVNNNYLKYGSDQANWRVLGLYRLDNGDIVAKMITNKPI